MASADSTFGSSKVTLTDVYETLRKLEEVEQFPIQSQVDDDIPILEPQAPNRVDSILSFLDETNQSDMTLESVRSQKSSTRDQPSPVSVRLNPPPVSHRQAHKKLTQSVAAPPRPSSAAESSAKHSARPTRAATHKSVLVVASPPEDDDDEDEIEATRTAHDVTETVLQLRMENEEKARQILIVQQRLVMHSRVSSRFAHPRFRINNAS